MKKYLTIAVILFLFFSCARGITMQDFDNFKEGIDDGLTPIGTYFWDEFSNLKQQYGLTQNESKLLGNWINISIQNLGLNNNYYFFPNKLFILQFQFEKYQIISSENLFFTKALGTWSIIDGMVNFTIYTIIIKDTEKSHPNNKEVFFLESPYTINFTKIDNIHEEGFTKRSVNSSVLSKELQQMVTIVKHKKNNEPYVRMLHVLNPLKMNLITGKLEKDYGYFSIVPELAQKNITGLEIATNPELIEKYIFPLWP